LQVTLAELHDYYASLSDEMLQQIDPAELTELARQYYSQEIKTRGLTGESAQAPPATEESFEADVEIEPDWLESAACACSFTAYPGSNHAPEAARAHDALMAAGVPCYLSVVEPDPSVEGSSRYDEYRVLVPHALNLKAISVLDKEIFNRELEDDWKTHLAELSDDELQALSPEVICAGLLDRANRLTRAYNDEIARRKSE
jgi:hypothetical protein